MGFDYLTKYVQYVWNYLSLSLSQPTDSYQFSESFSPIAHTTCSTIEITRGERVKRHFGVVRKFQICEFIVEKLSLGSFLKKTILVLVKERGIAGISNSSYFA